MAAVPPFSAHLTIFLIGDTDANPCQARARRDRRRARPVGCGPGIRPSLSPPSPPPRLGPSRLRLLRLCAAPSRPRLLRLDRERAPVPAIARVAGLRTLPEQALTRRNDGCTHALPARDSCGRRRRCETIGFKLNVNAAQVSSKGLRRR